jgi:2-iminobutanoate/2-iminopropanoate deaminase
LSGIVCASLVAGCSGMGETTMGGRPLIYKNAPADEVEMKAGIPRKVDPNAEAAAPVRPAPAAAPQPAPRRSENVAQARPATPAPALGDFAARYTQASRYGDLLFVSGQIGNDLATGNFTGGDIGSQARRALENVQAVLEANRLTMANIVSTTVYLTNISNLSAMDAVYHEFFRGNPPARTVVEVSNLPRGALVEISVVAGR